MKKIMRHGVKTLSCILLAAAMALTGLYIPVWNGGETSAVTVSKAASPVVERAISWAVSTANDNSHGYSQSNRWGPNYDCSSFVITAFRNAGLNVGSATYTGNMRAQFTQHGFQWIPWSQIGGTSKLQRGDILLNEVTHTEIYLGNNQNVGAHSSRGNPQTGDQTGTEVSVSGYYFHPWNGVLRYTGGEVCNCSTSYAGDYYVSTNSLPLTMRSGHGTGYSVVTSIPKGSQVYVSKADGSWAHVQWNGYSGFCSMAYLSRVSSKSYNLHVWVSDSGMGNVPSDFRTGNRYYICYELIDETTGRKANETSNISYKATETVSNSKGKIFEYTYDNSDYNWISTVCNSEDTYTGVVSISGDIDVSCSISFDVYENTAPQIKTWTWKNKESQEIETTSMGETTDCSYLIRDKYTCKNLNDVTSYWTTGNGYTVTIQIFDPDGLLNAHYVYKNKDNAKFSFVPDKAGEYKIKTDVSGNITGSREETIKSIKTVPTKAPTALPTPTKRPTSGLTGIPITIKFPSTARTPVPFPKYWPTTAPTAIPTPTKRPTTAPTAIPTPTKRPTAAPTAIPTPTKRPTKAPTTIPTPTKRPTTAPTALPTPTKRPTTAPTALPTPTKRPTTAPTALPTPTKQPTTAPAKHPAAATSETPTKTPPSLASDTTAPKGTTAPASKHTHHPITTVPEKATLYEDGTIIERCNSCRKILSTREIPHPDVFELKDSLYTYDGNNKHPAVIALDSDGHKISEDYYDITYDMDSYSVGDHAVTVTFKGNYCGSEELYFSIIPKGTNIKKLTARKRQITIKWKKQNEEISGYQARCYPWNKKGKKITIKGKKCTRTKLSGLKRRKKYYVRIRTYKTVNGENYYSPWSSAKTVRTK